MEARPNYKGVDEARDEGQKPTCSKWTPYDLLQGMIYTEAEEARLDLLLAAELYHALRRISRYLAANEVHGRYLAL